MTQISLSVAVVIIFFLRVAMGLRLVFPAWREDEFFNPLSKNKIIHCINKWALFVSGLFLVFGFFVRLAAGVSILLMLAYWFIEFKRSRKIITEHIVYIAVLAMLILINAGIFIGYDYTLLQIPAFLKYYNATNWLAWLL